MVQDFTRRNEEFDGLAWDFLEEEEAVNKSRSMTLNMQDILNKVLNLTRIKFLSVRRPDLETSRFPSGC